MACRQATLRTRELGPMVKDEDLVSRPPCRSLSERPVRTPFPARLTQSARSAPGRHPPVCAPLQGRPIAVLVQTVRGAT